MWRAAFWVAALGIIATYGFFWILGGISFSDSIVLSGLVIVLAVAWIIHSVLERRRGTDGRDPRLVHARERRGF
jgi:hypothetical protein